ncbi:TetR/AcrR family transcriptional regulator [Cohnella sp. GCM10012308]|uniref:TetR/AcrR family transcriptional regulator n=1 Tax=Cohnella sp. GCM10012308 TaxID=3317329 RepID=UPI003618E8B3
MLISQRQKRKQHQTVAALKKALVQLILDNNDIGEITVSEIAGQADLNRGTFYAHYHDKNEMIEDLFHDAVDGFTHALREPYKDVRRVALDGIVPSTKLIFEHIENNKDLFKALSLIRLTPNLYDRLEQASWTIFTEEMSFEREAGSTETEYEMFLSYQIHSTLGVIKFWIRKDFKYSADYVCRQLTSYYSEKITAMVITKP